MTWYPSTLFEVDGCRLFSTNKFVLFSQLNPFLAEANQGPFMESQILEVQIRHKQILNAVFKLMGMIDGDKPTGVVTNKTKTQFKDLHHDGLVYNRNGTIIPTLDRVQGEEGSNLKLDYVRGGYGAQVQIWGVCRASALAQNVHFMKSDFV